MNLSISRERQLRLDGTFRGAALAFLAVSVFNLPAANFSQGIGWLMVAICCLIISFALGAVWNIEN